LLLALVLTVAALALPAASTARRSTLDACELISTAKLASILGVQHAEIERNIAGITSPDNVSGLTHSVCNGLAWSGAAPTSQSGALQAVANGDAAAFAIDTWAPDNASRYVVRWTGKGYDDLLGTSIIGTVVLPGFPPFQPYHLQRLHAPTKGGDAIGVSGSPSATVTTIRAASGIWWSDKTSEIVSIAIGGSAHNPTVTQLNRIAAVALAAFGLKALPLH
jgi:hypothetical protein